MYSSFFFIWLNKFLVLLTQEKRKKKKNQQQQKQKKKKNKAIDEPQAKTTSTNKDEITCSN